MVNAISFTQIIRSQHLRSLQNQKITQVMQDGKQTKKAAFDLRHIEKVVKLEGLKPSDSLIFRIQFQRLVNIEVNFQNAELLKDFSHPNFWKKIINSSNIIHNAGASPMAEAQEAFRASPERLKKLTKLVQTYIEENHQQDLKNLPAFLKFLQGCQAETAHT